MASPGFTSRPTTQCRSSAFPQDPFHPGSTTATEAALSPATSPGLSSFVIASLSHSGKPQLFPGASFLKTSTIWVALPLPSSAAEPGTTLALNGPQFLCDDSKETLYRRFCRSDACLLITALLHPQLTSTDCPNNTKVSLWQFLIQIIT